MWLGFDGGGDDVSRCPVFWLASETNDMLAAVLHPPSGLPCPV